MPSQRSKPPAPSVKADEPAIIIEDVTVTFTRRAVVYGVAYQRGMEAGFPPSIAFELVRQGVAVTTQFETRSINPTKMMRK